MLQDQEQLNVYRGQGGGERRLSFLGQQYQVQVYTNIILSIIQMKTGFGIFRATGVVSWVKFVDNFTFHP